MDVTVEFTFCSIGDFRGNPLFERTRWENQYGHGVDIQMNFVWFHFSFEIYCPNKVKEVLDEPVL